MPTTEGETSKLVTVVLKKASGPLQHKIHNFIKWVSAEKKSLFLGVKRVVCFLVFYLAPILLQVWYVNAYKYVIAPKGPNFLDFAVL